jgi:hypothetical protein
LTSSDIRADGSRPGIHAQPPLREVVVATVRLGIALFVRENPIRPVVFSSWFRAVCLSLLFTLLGVAAGGAAAGDFSFIGSIILVGSEEVIGLTSDVPMRDRIDGTYWRVRASRLPPFATFALRVFPVIGAGLASSAVAAVTVGLLTGRLPLVLSLLPAFPLALVSLLSGAAVGLFVIAPAIGTRYDTLTYNTMTALLAVFSGALTRRHSSAVEQLFRKQQVLGSNPSVGSTPPIHAQEDLLSRLPEGATGRGARHKARRPANLHSGVRIPEQPWRRYMRTRTPLSTAPSIPLPDSFQAELDSFLLSCEAENLAPKTLRTIGSGRAPGPLPRRSGDAHRARAHPPRARRGVHRRPDRALAPQYRSQSLPRPQALLRLAGRGGTDRVLADGPDAPAAGAGGAGPGSLSR